MMMMMMIFIGQKGSNLAQGLKITVIGSGLQYPIFNLFPFTDQNLIYHSTTPDLFSKIIHTTVIKTYQSLYECLN